MSTGLIYPSKDRATVAEREIRQDGAKQSSCEVCQCFGGWGWFIQFVSFKLSWRWKLSSEIRDVCCAWIGAARGETLHAEWVRSYKDQEAGLWMAGEGSARMEQLQSFHLHVDRRGFRTAVEGACLHKHLSSELVLANMSRLNVLSDFVLCEPVLSDLYLFNESCVGPACFV